MNSKRRQSSSEHPADDESQAPVPVQNDQTDDEYKVQYMDVSEIVNRRLRESRLRQLMEVPSASTNQKRKRHDMEGEGDGGGQDVEGSDDRFTSMMSPMKKLKTVGNFESVANVQNESKTGGALKRLFSGSGSGEKGQNGDKKDEGRGRSKRRKRM